MTTSAPVLVVPRLVLKPCKRCGCARAAHEHGPERHLADCAFCDSCRRFRHWKWYSAFFPVIPLRLRPRFLAQTARPQGGGRD